MVGYFAEVPTSVSGPGNFYDLAPDHPQLFAYTRTLGDETLLILLNFSREPVEIELPAGVAVGERLLGNLATPSEGTRLAGWEARVHRVR